MKYFLLSIAIALLTGVSLFAQSEDSNRFTRVYGSFAMTNAEAELFKSSTDLDKGFRIGAIEGFRIMPQFPAFICVGGDVTYVTFADEIARESLINVAIPLQLTARFGSSDFNVEPFAGINVKFNTLAQVSNDDMTFDFFDEDDIGKDNTFNRTQMGFQVGAGINIHDIYFGYEYRIDITPMQSELKMKTQTLFFSLGYNF